MQTKYRFMTFHKEMVEFFEERGVKVRPLYYLHDEVCYEVQLRGRANIRLAQQPEVQAMASFNAIDMRRVLNKRITHPVWVATLNGQYLNFRDKDDNEYAAFAPNEQTLRDAVGDVPIGVECLSTPEQIKAYLDQAEQEDVTEIRYLIGLKYTYHNHKPFQETYPIAAIRTALDSSNVTAAKAD